MSMSKKDFIALANVVIETNHKIYYSAGPESVFGEPVFGIVAIHKIADFCASQNPRFNRDRWLSYIAGECGPSGGKVKKAVSL